MRTLHTFAACLVLSLWTTACSTPVEKDPGACTKTADCTAGQACLSGKCIDLPCGGKCSDEQVCLNDECRSALNLDCSLDPDRCPKNSFTCSEGRCKRSCDEDADCPAPGTCNIDLFICAECALDLDCTDPARPHCDPTGACVGCLSNSQCRDSAGRPQGKYCNQETQTCEAGCQNVLDCPVGTKTCLGATDEIAGKCAECTSNIDCTGVDKKHCDPATNTCVACLQNDQCASNACDTARKMCVNCVDDLSCGRGMVCDPTIFDCVPGCTRGSGSAECPPSAPACDPDRGTFGACVACVTNADCPRAQVCDKSGSMPACVPGCDNDTRCESIEDPSVVTTICDPTKGAKGTCVQCRSDANCGNGQICDATSGMCRCKKAGESCTSSSECGYQEVTGPGGVTTFNCQALNSFCITKIKCDLKGEYTVPSVCSTAVKGAGLPDRNPPDTTGCPAGFAVERATDASGTYKVVCVPKQAPYTCY